MNNFQEERWRKNLRSSSSMLQNERAYSWWTGKHPSVCPGIKDGILTSLPMPNLNYCTRTDVLDYFDNTWTLTETLFSALRTEEAFYRPPHHQLRHPLIFYYAHPVVFYINKLRIAGILKEPINAYFEQLFEIGVDEMSWDDLSKNQSEWPSIEEVTAYRSEVYRCIKHVIETHPALDQLPITWNSPLWALFMGFEHERIHLETSSVLMRELPIYLVKKPRYWSGYFNLTNEEPHPTNNFIPVQSREVVLGKSRETPVYGWDNEYGRNEITVAPFQASECLISNGEFLKFVKDGGYQEPRYWSAEGWQWRSFRNAKWPAFWVPDGPSGLHQFNLRLCFDVVSMQFAWPVNVNFHEAKAYCAWLSEQEKAEVPYRLLTEAEHHCLRETARGENVNQNLLYASENSVNANKKTADGFYDVFGNVWQWCEDYFAPLPGFKVHPYYDDFSAPCFDDQHNLMMGGSFISTGDEAMVWARFHFRRHFFQHAGFRVVKPSGHENQYESAQDKQDKYETQQLLNQYLLMHFGGYEETVKFPPYLVEAVGFPARCAQRLVEVAKKWNVNCDRALDIGCAVGGACFELARTFSDVVGIDLSQSFIDTATELKQTGKWEYVCKDEGERKSSHTIQLDLAIDRSRAQFLVGDACALPADLGQFDVVLMANLLCRLPDPTACLQRMGGANAVVRPGGLLLTVSPYSWLPQFTPVSAWLGGYEKDGSQIQSIDGLRTALGGEFEQLDEWNMPLVIREHARKFEYIISHAVLWRRNKCIKTGSKGEIK